MRLALALLLPLPFLAFAQDEELPPDEVADLVERYVERGVESMREGSYDEARLRFSKALKRDGKHKQAQLGIAESYRRVGAYDKAEGVLRKRLEQEPSDRDAKVALAELDLLRGRVVAAKPALRSVIEKGGEGPDLTGLRARYVLAEALASQGKRGDARTVLDLVVKTYERRLNVLADAAFHSDTLKNKPEKARPLSREMTLMAAALRLYVQLSPLDHDYLQNAYELIGHAKDLDAENWEAWIEEVRVTREERERAIGKARRNRELVARRNPELADLYVEVAKSVMTGFNSAEGQELAGMAVRINPSHTGARAILARALLEDNRYSEAEEHIEKGLKVNPRHRDLLALKATQQLLLGDRAGFEAGMKEMLAVDPTYGEGYHLAGLVVASRQRRYDTGVDLVREGLRLDPMNFQAHAALGIFLANLGRAEEARESLIKSKKLFPFSHPVRNNFKQVLDYVLGSMTEMKTEHFRIRFDPGEYDVLSRFLPELLEECWTDMVGRYGFTPKTPVLVEVFRNANDFSVRTLGLPGIPALGACFGGLITLDSPQALPAGKFSWAATARHEFAHVMSLQLSGGQVPRWFTEGLSVLEERPLDTGWGREERFEKEVYDAWATGTLPKIATFDGMFRSPRVAFAYHVAGLMLQFLKERSGEKGIVKALRLYGKDTRMRRVFREAFELELEEFDKQFAQFIEKRVQAYKIQPNYNVILAQLRSQALKDPTNGKVLIKLAWAYYQRRKFVDSGAYLDRVRKHLPENHPQVLLLDANLSLRAGRQDRARDLFERFFKAGGDDFHARMTMAGFVAGKDKARFEKELKAAKACWPLRVSGRNPYALLRRLYMTDGRDADALKELEELAAIASKSIGARLQLAREYGRAGRDKDAIRVLEEALRITVFDARVLGGLLPLYRKAKAHEKAIRAARCRVALRNEKDEDVVIGNRWLDLTEVLLEAGKVGEAKVAFAEAKKLADPEDPRVAEVKARLEQKTGQ